MSAKEIVWFAGRTEPTFVIIRDGGDDAHYFYWPYEISLPKFIKGDDIEPVKAFQHGVLSRYHYFGLTVWIHPLYHNTKPIADFMDNFHTPTVIPDPRKAIRINVEPLLNQPSISTHEKAIYWVARCIFQLKLGRKRPKYRKPASYSSKIVKEVGQPISDSSHLFDAAYIRNFILEVILIGDPTDIAALVQKIKDTSGSDSVTSDALINHFKF